MERYSITDDCLKNYPIYTYARKEGNIEYRTASGQDDVFFTTIGWKILNLRQKEKAVGEKEVTRVERDKWGYKLYETDGGGNDHVRTTTRTEKIYELYTEYDLYRDLTDPKVKYFLPLEEKENEINQLINQAKHAESIYKYSQADEKDLFAEYRKRRHTIGFSITSIIGFLIAVVGVLGFFNNCQTIFYSSLRLIGFAFLGMVAFGLIFIIVGSKLKKKREKLIRDEFERSRSEELRKLGKEYYTGTDLVNLRKNIRNCINDYWTLYDRLKSAYRKK